MPCRHRRCCSRQAHLLSHGVRCWLLLIVCPSPVVALTRPLCSSLPIPPPPPPFFLHARTHAQTKARQPRARLHGKNEADRRDETESAASPLKARTPLSLACRTVSSSAATKPASQANTFAPS
ncbi:hypothetical protein IWX49DRAFT_11589 [Phyllosticta citricarpa]